MAGWLAPIMLQRRRRERERRERETYIVYSLLGGRGVCVGGGGDAKKARQGK